MSDAETILLPQFVTALRIQSSKKETSLDFLDAQMLAFVDCYKRQDLEPGGEIDSAYDRFQNIISMLELYDAKVSCEDAKLKFLRSLPPVWHVVATMIRGQPGLDELDFDDLYKTWRLPRGYVDSTNLAIPEIAAANFEIKHGFFHLLKRQNLRELRLPISNKDLDESFSEAWDRFKDLYRACPHHGSRSTRATQLDTFYNALNANDQDSLNPPQVVNFLDKRPTDCSSIHRDQVQSSSPPEEAKAIVG
ncbi:hypothetical protein Tco_0568964 [Tanacetum coccineum]